MKRPLFRVPIRVLLLAICVTLVGLALAGVRLGQNSLLKVERSVDSVDGPMPGIYRAANIRDLLLMQQVYVIKLISAPSSKRDELGEALQSVRQQIKASLAEYEREVRSTEERDLLAAVKSAHVTGNLALDRIASAMRSGNTGLASSIVQSRQWEEDNDQMDSAIADLVLWNKKNGDAIASAAAHAVKEGIADLSTAGYVTVMSGVGLSWLLIRSVRKRIQPILAIVERVGNGDLSGRVSVPVRDEIGRIGIALNSSLDSMSNLLQTIRSAANEMKVAGADLDVFSRNVQAGSGRTADAAASLSKASQSISGNTLAVSQCMEDMRAAIKDIAVAATSAAELAAKACQAMGDTRDSTMQLNDASQRIQGIVDVIKELSSQTNLLALNASVEAARAGDSGRSFAVVADEVGALARRTATASNQVRGSLQGVLSGSSQAVQSMDGITAMIHKLAEASQVIATAVAGQDRASAGISEQVSRTADGAESISGHSVALAKVAAGTSRGAAKGRHTVERVCAAAKEMDELVSRFRLSA